MQWITVQAITLFSRKRRLIRNGAKKVSPHASFSSFGRTREVAMHLFSANRIIH